MYHCSVCGDSHLQVCPKCFGKLSLRTIQRQKQEIELLQTINALLICFLLRQQEDKSKSAVA